MSPGVGTCLSATAIDEATRALDAQEPEPEPLDLGPWCIRCGKFMFQCGCRNPVAYIPRHASREPPEPARSPDAMPQCSAGT